jgi:hypothetical protein
MAGQAQGRSVPMWVFVATFVGVAILAGAVGWFIANSSPAPKAGPVATTTSTVEPTKTVETTSTIPATVTVEPTKTPTPTPATVKELCIVTNVSWTPAKKYRITVDYVQMLTGKAAADRATADGQESPPPNDYYLVNDNPKLRTFSVAAAAPVYLLGWGGTDATFKTKRTIDDFLDIMPGGVNPQTEWVNGYYWVTVKAGKTVTRIEQQFFP